MKKITDKINISNKRLKDEAFEDYKKRRLLVKQIIKKYLSGFVIWQPKLPIGSTGKVAGPYIKKLHGELNYKNSEAENNAS